MIHQHGSFKVRTKHYLEPAIVKAIEPLKLTNPVFVPNNIFSYDYDPDQPICGSADKLIFKSARTAQSSSIAEAFNE